MMAAGRTTASSWCRTRWAQCYRARPWAGRTTRDLPKREGRRGVSSGSHSPPTRLAHPLPALSWPRRWKSSPRTPTDPFRLPPGQNTWAERVTKKALFFHPALSDEQSSTLCMQMSVTPWNMKYIIENPCLRTYRRKRATVLLVHKLEASSTTPSGHFASSSEPLKCCFLTASQRRRGWVIITIRHLKLFFPLWCDIYILICHLANFSLGQNLFTRIRIGFSRESTNLHFHSCWLIWRIKINFPSPGVMLISVLQCAYKFFLTTKSLCGWCDTYFYAHCTGWLAKTAARIQCGQTLPLSASYEEWRLTFL